MFAVGEEFDTKADEDFFGQIDGEHIEAISTAIEEDRNPNESASNS